MHKNLTNIFLLSLNKKNYSFSSSDTLLKTSLLQTLQQIQNIGAIFKEIQALLKRQLPYLFLIYESTGATFLLLKMWFQSSCWAGLTEDTRGEFIGALKPFYNSVTKLKSICKSHPQDSRLSWQVQRKLCNVSEEPQCRRHEGQSYAQVILQC